MFARLLRWFCCQHRGMFFSRTNDRLMLNCPDCGLVKPVGMDDPGRASQFRSVTVSKARKDKRPRKPAPVYVLPRTRGQK